MSPAYLKESLIKVFLNKILIAYGVSFRAKFNPPSTNFCLTIVAIISVFFGAIFVHVM